MSFLPAQPTLRRHAEHRWWAFEDGRPTSATSRRDTTDLAKLLLLEFGLVYANDWFLIPHALPAGSSRTSVGIAVTNVFGERFWIEPAGRPARRRWQRWSMFTLDARARRRAGRHRPAAAADRAEDPGEPRRSRRCVLIRDEMANMVWGIETRVPLPTGDSRPGQEAARETLALHRRLLRQAIDAGDRRAAGAGTERARCATG